MKIEWLSILGLTIVIALTFVFFEVNPQQFQQPGFLQQSINMTAISVQTDVGQEWERSHGPDNLISQPHVVLWPQS